MGKIIWTKRSRKDLESIFDYISTDSKRYARETINKIILSTEILRSQPKAGRIVPEIMEENLRELIVGNYRIIYEIHEGFQIAILTVHHSSRKMENIKY